MTIEDLRGDTGELMTDSRADAARELSRDELGRSSGGMVWQKGTVNPDVVDARGGSLVIFGFIATFDANGELSSVRST